MLQSSPKRWNLFDRFFYLDYNKVSGRRKKPFRMELEHLESRWNPTNYMTSFVFDIPASVASLGVKAGMYSNTDSIYLDPNTNQFVTIPTAGSSGNQLPLITLAAPGSYQKDQQFTLNIPYPATTGPGGGEFKGGELILFVGDVVNGLPISPNSNSVGAPTAAANPSTSVPPDNYAQIELTYIPSGSGAGLDIDSSSVDNVGFPFTLTYPTTGPGASGFPINPLGITLSQTNLYNTFNNLIDNGIIPQEFQQCSTFNQQQDQGNIQIIAPGDILSHNATTPVINAVQQVSTTGNLQANYNYFYVITAYSDNLIESYNLDTATGAVTTGNSGVRGETLLSNSFPSSILASGKSNQINFSPYLDPNTAGYNIYRFSTPDANFNPNGDTVYNLIAQIPKAQASTVQSTFQISPFSAGSTSLTITSGIANLSKGMLVAGAGIAPNTFISQIDSTTITISVPTIGNGGGNSNSYTGSTHQFVDTGSIPQAKQISTNTASSYGFNPLSEYYTDELLEFYGHYTQPNSFALTRTNVQWVGNTVLYSPAGSWNTTNSFYMALQLTAANGDGSSIHAGDTLNVYAPFFQTNTRFVTINNQSLSQMPGWLSLTDTNGQQGIGNLYESPSQMVFGCDSVFASNGKDPDTGDTTSALGTYIGSIEDSIAAAFNRGIATNFAIQPDNWASFPAISGNPVVTGTTTGAGATYYYAVTAMNVLGESTPSLVVPATFGQGQTATINWTQNPNPVPPSLGFKIYRGTSPDIAQMQLLQQVDGATFTYQDHGGNIPTPNINIHPPYQYYAANSTSNWYSYFTQTNSSVDPVDGVSINGLSYGFAYADQGGLSTNAFYTTGNFPPTVGVHLGLISGPEFVTQLLADATQSQPYTQKIQLSGNVSNLNYALQSGSLPAGLSLNSSTGVISGTPTSTGSFTFTIQVTGQENTSPFQISRTFGLTVNSSSASSPLSITGLTVTATGTKYLTLEPVSLGGQSYSRTINVSGGTGPYTLTPTANIGIPLFTQFPLNQKTPITSTSGNFDLNTIYPWQVGTGLQGITFELKDSATPTPNIITFQLETDVLPVLTINNPGTANAYVGVPFYQKLTTNQNPTQVPEYPWGELTYTLANGSNPLPAGLTLTPWGIIQGTPTTSSGSPTSFTVQVTNMVTGIAETVTATCSIHVQPNNAYIPLTISNPGTLIPVLGTSYNNASPLATITTTGGSGGVQLALINGQLPTGLNFDGTKITGSVSASSKGDFPVTFRAIDIQGHIAFQNVTISVTSISPPSTQSKGVPIPYDVYQATNSLVIPGTGFNASTPANNVLTVNSTINTTIQNSTTLNQLVAKVNTALPTPTSVSQPITLGLQLAVNGGTAVTSSGYANIRPNPTILANNGNIAQNASTLLISGTNFGTGTGIVLYGPRYFINAADVTNEATLVLTDSQNHVIPFTSIGNGDYLTTMEISGLDLSNAATGALNAKLVVNGQTIIGPIQVATIVPALGQPSINPNFNQSNLSNNLVISGTGFSPAGNGNLVVVELIQGTNHYTVPSSDLSNISDTSLEISNSFLQAHFQNGDKVNAKITVNGIVNSGGSFQVANFQSAHNSIVNSQPGNFYPASIPANSPFQMAIYGYGFTQSSTSNLNLYYSTAQAGNTALNPSQFTKTFVNSNLILATINPNVIASSWTNIGSSLNGPSQVVTSITQGSGSAPSGSPSISASTGGYSANDKTLTINGSNFATANGSSINNFVSLSYVPLSGGSAIPLDYGFIAPTQQGSQGNQFITVNNNGNQLVIHLSGSLPAGDIYATVNSYGVSSGTAVKVATIASSTSGPTITTSNQQISANPTRIIISGTNFDPNGSNVLSLSQGTVVSLTADSTTQLTAIVDGITNPGALNASVVVNGVSSAAVQVAKVIASGPDIQFSIGNLSPTASHLIISGANFSTTSSNNTVTLFTQAGPIAGAISGVTANSTSQLKVALAANKLQNIPAGQLYATVAVNNSGNTTSDTVQVAHVSTTTLPAPTITTSTANLSQSASSLVIQGTNFDPTGTNVLSLTDSAIANVPYASIVVNSATQITVNFSSSISITGALYAEVVTDGQQSNRAQVATVVASTAPTITQSSAAIAANATTLTINGTGFSTTASGNQVELSSGNVTNVTVNGTGTQLTVTLNPSAGLLAPGTLTAKVTVHGEVAGPTQVATVNAVPVITPGSQLLPANSQTLTINGTGFSATANLNTVTFSSGSGTVTSATPNALTVTLNSAPTAGNLTATVVSNSISSLPAIINTVQPVITANNTVIDQQTATTITINGTGFDSDKTKNSVLLSSGAGVVTAASPTQLTVQFTTKPSVGTLLATVTSNNVASVQTQVATVGTKSVKLSTQADGAVDGLAFATQPVITFLDASGQRMSADNTSVVAMAVSTGATTIGTVTATAVNGQATFSNVGIDGTPGNQYTLTFTSAGFQAASQPITLSANTATQLGLSRNAVGAVDGQAFTTQPIVTILNSQGQLVSTDNTSIVTMSVSDGATTVGTTAVKAVNGVVNFTNAGIAGKAGVPYILTFSFASLKPATQSITILPGAPTQVSLVSAANGAVNNAAFTSQPVLNILDHYGQLVTADNSTQVTISVNNGASMIGTFTRTAVNGVVNFSGSGAGIVGSPGSNYTLTYSANGLTSATQPIQLSPSSIPTQLGVFRQAGGSTSGSAFTTQPVIHIENSSGALVSSTANVTMTVSNGASVVGTSTVAAVNGVATFSNVGISGNSGVTYTLTFSSTGLTPATQPIVISPLVPAKLGFTTQASGASDGRPFVVQPVMLVQDASGQTVTTDNTTQVTLNVSSGASTIGTITRTAVNGVVTFTNAGIDGLPNTNYTLTYTSSGLAPATQPIYLNPGLATHLNLSIPAAGATVGNAFTTQPVLQILDAFNQIVTTDSTSLVTMQVTSGATIIGNSSATAKNGIVTFGNVGLTGNTGNYTLSFVSTPLVPAHQTIALAPFMPLVTGSNPGIPGSPGVSTVNLYDPQTGQQTGTVVPFPGFVGEIRVATGDFDGDGRFEIVAAAGQGGGPAVTILDSATGATKASFFAYDPAFTGGVFVAVKDVNNDGVADIITGAGAGGGPHVKIFNGVNLQTIQSFFAYAPDFTGGVTVATADINGDHVFDVVTGAGAGGGPHVKVFDGATNNLISSWFAYPVDFTGGVFVGMGDISNDGSFEVITGAGAGGGPVVAVWNPFTGALLSQFMAYASVFTGGVRVGVVDATGDGILDLVTGAGPGGGPHVRAFTYPGLDLLYEFYSGPRTDSNGVFVS